MSSYRDRRNRLERSVPMAAVVHDRTTHVFNEGISRQTRTISHLNEQMRKENTKLAYNPKINEFQEYCRAVHGNLPPSSIYLVTNAKLYDFLCYVAFRPKRKGGKRKHGESSADGFRHEEYKEVMEKHFGPSRDSDDTPVLPTDSLGFDAVNTYKAAIFNIHREQAANQSTSLSWRGQIWQGNCDNLMKHVKVRKKVMAKQNYEEKMDTHFSFFKAHDKDVVIEEVMWEDGQKASSLRVAFPTIR